MSKFEELKLVDNLSTLSCGDKVYSKTFGYGDIVRLYKKEIIVRFLSRTIRVAPDDNDIELFHVDKKKLPRNSIKASANGEKVSFTKLKNIMRQEVADEYVSQKNAAYVLGIKPAKLKILCEMNKINISNFGIANRDFFVLKDIIFKLNK